jgi:hypothetical protein
MKPAQPKKKYVANLPADFQEVLMSTEMELQQGLNVQILRKLVYLYTRGMQYYDLIHKDKFKQFYSDKLVSLLTRKNVENFLDKNPINFEERDDLDLLFQPKKKNDSKIDDENDEKEEEEKNIKNEIDYEMKDFSKKIRKNSMKLVKTKLKDYDIKLFVKKKLLQVNSNLNKIDEALTNEMIEQMSEFEENKRKRKVKKSQNNIIININNKETNENEIIKNEEINKEKENNKETQEDKNSDTNSISTPSSNDEETISNNQNIIKSTEDELKILELSGFNTSSQNKIIEEKNEKPISNSNTPTKNLIGNNPMLREIEDYVQKNMNEMYQALEELKASFQEEINEAEENGFDDIANGLKEDLQVELDNLKDQYEEQRRTEKEKIKAKYAKRNVIID